MESKQSPKNIKLGNKWVHDLPQGWSLRRLRFNCRINAKQNKHISNEEQIVSFLPMGKVTIDGEIDYSSTTKYWEVSSGYTYFENKDVLIAKITPCFENGKGALVDNLLNGFGFGSTEFHILKANKKISPKFLYYFTCCDFFRVVGAAFMEGSAGQKRISSEFVKDFLMPTPPTLIKQIKMATYLDTKISKINLTLDKDKQLIDLLKERRASLINCAVTRGLDPKAELKDSGIKWIDKMPSNWNLIKLKYITRERRSKSAESDKKNGYIGLENIEGQTGHLIGVTSFENIKGQALKFKKRDVLFGKLRPYLAKVIVAEIDGNCTSELIVYECCEEAVPYFLKYRLLSKSYIDYVNSLTYGAKMPRVDPDQLSNLKLPLPDKSDQIEIARFLSFETSIIDNIINKVGKRIDNTQEYKKSLINNVVTGKIDVRDI